MRAKYIEILQKELVMAMGCTEPLALAYAGSIARAHIATNINKVIIKASNNIIKNVRSVNIPKFPGMMGIEASVLLGLFGGNHDKGFACIDEVTQAQQNKALMFLKTDKVTLEQLASDKTLHIILQVITEKDDISVEIVDHHLNVIKIIKNNQILFKKENESLTQTNYKELLKFENIYNFSKNVDLELVSDIVDLQFRHNFAISEYGINADLGVQIGKTILEHDNSLWGKIKAYSAAGSEARMCGSEMPVVINSGSGNQGLSASVPIIVYGKEKQKPLTEIYRALIFANLLTIKQKINIGALSAYCGIVSSSGAASAGLTFLAGGNFSQTVMTMKNYLATVPGIICDGAKASCASKITVALDGAILAHQLAMNNKFYADGTGILTDDIDETINIVSEIACKGMRQTDNKIMKYLIKN